MRPGPPTSSCTRWCRRPPRVRSRRTYRRRAARFTSRCSRRHAEATGTYAVQVFDLSAPIENAPPDWPKASVSEPPRGDLPADWTTTGFLGHGDATGRRTSGDTDWFEMELNPSPGTADADVMITTSRPVVGSMKIRTIGGQTLVVSRNRYRRTSSSSACATTVARRCTSRSACSGTKTRNLTTRSPCSPCPGNNGWSGSNGRMRRSGRRVSPERWPTTRCP